MTYASLERTVRPWVRKAQLQRAIARCESQLASLPPTEYQRALGRSWLKQTDEASRWLAGFYRTAAKAFPVRAVYCEMNRFEINPDEWYIDAFAYDFFGGPQDLGWLVGWKKSASRRNRLVLRGMPDLQSLFARDYGDIPPDKVRAASEALILLLTLRMQELIHAAAVDAHKSRHLPHDVPVLAAVHDSDLVCFSYGSVKPPVTRREPPRPAVGPAPRPGARHGIYEVDGGWDEFNNSLPWDVLDFVTESDKGKYEEPLHKVKLLARKWKAPRVKLRRRKWRCDLIEMYPHWAVNEKARAALMPLLKKTVEFLPLRCAELSGVWVMHSLRHIDVASNASHDEMEEGDLTAIRRRTFDVDDLKGIHLFGIKPPTGSWARKAGLCFDEIYVSEEFKRVVETQGLQGVVFNKVFSYRPV